MKKDICPFCGNKRLYKVTQTSFKCSTCRRKYSQKKLEKDFIVLDCFCENLSVNECAKSLHLNYKSIKDRYMDFRKLTLLHVEEIYRQNRAEFSEYDEYYFLPQNKRGKVKYLFEAIGILGMVYHDLVYTLLLPDQFSHIKNAQKDIKITYMKEYAKYLNRYKIMHFEKFDSQLIRFWIFLEENLLHFKGVSKENFIYYLKEYEFKFNYTKEEQKKILWRLWIER
jgi:transposase-like protein/DNA-directed RNA polymerase subunit RPC12/RpoP